MPDHGDRVPSKRARVLLAARSEQTTYKANATVTKLPASPGLKLSGLRSGRHSLKVTVAYLEAVTKHAHKTKKTVSKTLTTTFNVC